MVEENALKLEKNTLNIIGNFFFLVLTFFLFPTPRTFQLT